MSEVFQMSGSDSVPSMSKYDLEVWEIVKEAVRINCDFKLKRFGAESVELAIANALFTWTHRHPSQRGSLPQLVREYTMKHCTDFPCDSNRAKVAEFIASC